MSFDPYTQRFAQNQLAQFNRLAAGRPATTTMDRTQMRLPNLAALPPVMRKPTVSPLLERVAAQARQGTALMPSLGGQAPSPTPQQPQVADTGLMGALRAPLMSPRGQAISQAALAGLEAGGYTTMPTTLGQAIGKMGQAALQGYGAGQDRALKEAQRKAAAEKAAFDRRMAIAEYEQKEREIGGKVSKEAKTIDQKVIDREISMAKDFRSESKNFRESMLNLDKITANATTKRPTGATDIAMIFNFMKALDPGSVVRGEEYESAAGAGSLLDSLGQAYNRLLAGEDEKLPDQVRKDFYQTALETFEPYVASQLRTEDLISEQAKALGMNPKNIIPKSLAPVIGSEEFPHLVYTEDEIMSLPAGKYFVFNGELGVTN